MIQYCSWQNTVYFQMPSRHGSWLEDSVAARPTYTALGLQTGLRAKEGGKEQRNGLKEASAPTDAWATPHHGGIGDRPVPSPASPAPEGPWKRRNTAAGAKMPLRTRTTKCSELTWYINGGVAQMVERSLSMREVPGSIPGASTIHFAPGFQRIQARTSSSFRDP